MNIRRPFLLTVLLLLSTFAFSQDNNAVEMADVMRSNGKIYFVVLGLLVVLTGLIFFILRVERKLVKLEKEIQPKR